MSAEASVASSAPAVFASAPAVLHPGFLSCVTPLPPHYLAPSALTAPPSSSTFAASQDDQFDPEYPDSLPRDPEVPIPPAVPDSFRAEKRRMYSYHVDLFPQAAGSPCIDPLRTLFENFFNPSTTHLFELVCMCAGGSCRFGYSSCVLPCTQASGLFLLALTFVAGCSSG